MAEIGEALREARMRGRIDMSQVESATKIRAKYLRALENEEWDLLPGPTFVKTFLRTYAEYLGLDARSLVEDYKQRFERPPSGELTPFAPVASRGGGRHRRRRPIGVWLLLLAVLALVLGGFWALGRDRDSQGGDARTATPGAGAQPSSASSGRRVRLGITATSRVRVCLIDAGGRRLISGDRLPAGRRTRDFTSSRFQVGLSGGSARLRVDDRSFTVSARPRPVGFDIRAGQPRRRLPARRIPSCR